jgi:aerobic carbon-monoxide dehydrogenase small subunit
MRSRARNRGRVVAKPIAVELSVNGREHHLFVDLTETLLTTLRDRLLLTGSKRGCNQGVCGACTVVVDGVPVRACLSLTANCVGAAIKTIEGCEGDRSMSVLQDAFVAEGALQCGFCTSGMLLAAQALLATNAEPSVAAVQEGLSGNLCRCTGYRKIITAVQLAAKELRR